MKKLRFWYSLKIDFDAPVIHDCFTVRCTLQSDERQTVIQQNMEIFPKEFLCENRDSFGNIYYFGRAEEAHNVFEVTTDGIVLTGCSEGTKAETRYKLGMFVGQTERTNPDGALRNLFEKIGISAGTNLEKSLLIMEALRSEFSYVQGVTDVTTTATQAWNIRKGVCQDYAHIMLSLCRMADIPCRYVTGMLIGEGLSHAWVEIESDGIWYGLDPTNGTRVLEDHIKISHGRDSEDCLINQGFFIGNATQIQNVSVNVQEVSFI